MSEENLRSYRNEVIERCISLELLLSGIISYHYFGNINMPFMLEVLYDENCSFGFKRKIVEKIVPEVDRSRINDLNRIGSIRNYFAHCHPNIIHPLTGDKVAVDTRKKYRTIDFENLYEEFQRLYPSVSKYLDGILQGFTGVPIRSLSDLLKDPEIRSRLPNGLQNKNEHTD